MAEHEQERKLEELLDSMLTAYSTVEPRPGLETRILASLRAEASQQHGVWSRFWIWAGAGVAVTVASVVLVILLLRPARLPYPAPTQALRSDTQRSAPTNGSVPGPLRARAATNNPTTKRAAARKAPPPNPQRLVSSWPAVFPTPVTLSEQERFLFVYLANTPREEVIAQIQRDDQKEVDEFWEDREPTPARSPRSANTR